MAKPWPGYEQKPLSLAHMRSVFAMTDPRKLAAFAASMPWDYHFERHTFTQALIAAEWSTDVTGAGSPVAFAYNAQRGGALRGSTGATSANVTALFKAQTYFDAADNPVMIIRFKYPAASTALALEVGFTDPKSDEKLVSVSDIDTPAIGNGVTDGVLFVVDTEQTLDTGLVGVGTSTAVAVTPVYSSGSTIYVPTASQWIELVIGVRAGLGYASIWDAGTPIGNRQWGVASGPDAGVLMRPSLIVKSLAGADKQIDIDHIILISERNATS